jgi:hypothetical protein
VVRDRVESELNERRRARPGDEAERRRRLGGDQCADPLRGTGVDREHEALDAREREQVAEELLEGQIPATSLATSAWTSE